MTYAPLSAFAENDGLTVDRLNQVYTAVQRQILFPYKLYDKPTGEANFTTTSTTFVAVDATVDKLNLTITTFGNPVEMLFSGAISNSVANAFTSLDIELDGALIGGASNTYGGVNSAAASQAYPTTLHRIKVLAAGSHTFKLMWKVTSGTGTLHASSNLQFFVREI